MVPLAIVRQYANGQQIGLDVADQDVVLHYALALLNEAGLVGRNDANEPGPLLFKGGTALRKCVFGETGRFSQDIDLDASHRNGFEAAIEAAFAARNPFHGIIFSIPRFRYSKDGNFSGTVDYTHSDASGAFELQISYRLEPILDPIDLELAQQSYFARVEFPPPALHGLDPYEMIGEKILACNRRRGGSAKDVYDLFLWAQRPFDEELVHRVSLLKAWTDQRRSPRYDPNEFLRSIQPANYRWEDLQGLVPRRLERQREVICSAVRERFTFLSACSVDDLKLLADQTSHREHRLFAAAREQARERRKSF